ncbi:MAG TPA: hypothetical protein PK886_00670 [Candidatus Paceibacterota bacterium]|nr:hypothetical protein [Candidatus Paceibacterota bacterium]
MKIKNKGFVKYVFLFITTIGFIGFFSVGSLEAQGIEPIFNPRYLNLDYIFYNFIQLLKAIWLFLTEGPLKSIFQAILAVISVFLIAVISYILIRLNELDKKQKKNVDKTIPGKLTTDEVNPTWLKIKAHVSSENPANWRMAIIEADLLLEDVITQMGYQGQSLGDKMKSIEQADFPMLQLAWEAHKVRNKIAHEGEKFILTQREARRVIDIFEAVLKDTGYFSR